MTGLDGDDADIPLAAEATAGDTRASRALESGPAVGVVSAADSSVTSQEQSEAAFTSGEELEDGAPQTDDGRLIATVSAEETTAKDGSPAPGHAGRWARRTAGVVAGVVVAAVAAGAVAFFAWPRASLGATQDSLARVTLPAFAGTVDSVEVHSADGTRLPVTLRRGKLWPQSQLSPGQLLNVAVTVRRPQWASWLVGRVQVSHFTTGTPAAQVRARFVEVRDGTPLTVSFDTPVQVVAWDGSSPRRLARPSAKVGLGKVAHGVVTAGHVTVAAAARLWEKLSPPTVVTWFASRPYVQVLPTPPTTEELVPAQELTLTFSGTIRRLLGSARPRLRPAVPGQWRVVDDDTLAFRPGGLGFGLGTIVRVELPRSAHIVMHYGSALTRTIHWRVKPASTLRLQQLLAQLGYLPLSWQPASELTSDSAVAEIAAAATPPRGRFSWRYADTPPELARLSHLGHVDPITIGALMAFENAHHMPADGHAGPKVWSSLIADVLAGRRVKGGYSYVFVHSSVPQSLNLWHNGRIIVTSPGNTGVPAAPTQLGTFPVFEHIPVGTMSGTNPSGSHYNDPGIRWISYFNGGDAIHAFTRASFGTPQSLGCVELPMAAAAKVWPYTPIGTLVTVEK